MASSSRTVFPAGPEIFETWKGSRVELHRYPIDPFYFASPWATVKIPRLSVNLYVSSFVVKTSEETKYVANYGELCEIKISAGVDLIGN